MLLQKRLNQILEISYNQMEKRLAFTEIKKIKSMPSIRFVHTQDVYLPGMILIKLGIALVMVLVMMLWVKIYMDLLLKTQKFINKFILLDEFFLANFFIKFFCNILQKFVVFCIFLLTCFLLFATIPVINHIFIYRFIKLFFVYELDFSYNSNLVLFCRIEIVFLWDTKCRIRI